MLVVLGVCPKDIDLAVRNIQWARKLNERVGFEALISCERGTDTTALMAEAQAYFKSVHHYTYDEHAGDPTWPEPQNWAWSHAARYIADHFKSSWLWLESDCVPLKSGWLDVLSKEYYE